MGLLDKVKNLFTEEVEIDEQEEIKPQRKKKNKEPIESIQKEVIKVEIPSPKETRTRSNSKKYEEIEDSSNVTNNVKDDYKFPFFDDDDFDVVDVKPKKEEKKVIKADIYNPPKEEKKIFKPSPIISPVFGFMDKNFSKEEIANQKKTYSSKKATVDEIRDKAFASLESDIENEMFGGRLLFDEDNNKMEDFDDEESLDKAEEFDSKVISEKPRHENMVDDEDLTDLLEAEMAKPSDKKEAKPRKISDKELFNLIDSMYEGEKNNG